MILKRNLVAAILVAFSAGSAWAFDPKDVVVSIKPIHSLVASVMQGVGDPTLLVKGSASEHGYSLKPSDAKILQSAKVVFWVGPELETYLTKPIEVLSDKAENVRLEQAPGLNLLPARQGGNFEAHDHGDDGGVHQHDEQDNHHDHHDDMHIWLDPQNAILMLQPIAKALGEADPEHAKQYNDNAAAMVGQLNALQDEIARELRPVHSKPYIVFHDAYQYFERRFDLAAAGSITLNPESAPGAARIRDLQDKLKSLHVSCVFSEPQFESGLVATVSEGLDVNSGVLDPMGADIKDGPDLYPQLMRNLAAALKSCLQ